MKMRMIIIYQLLVHKCPQKRKQIPLSHLTSVKETILSMRKNSNIANTRMNIRIVQLNKDNSRISLNLWITRRWSSTRMLSRSSMSRESSTSGISKCNREWDKGLISSRRVLKALREFMEDQGREVAQGSKWDLLSPWWNSSQDHRDMHQCSKDNLNSNSSKWEVHPSSKVLSEVKALWWDSAQDPHRSSPNNPQWVWMLLVTRDTCILKTQEDKAIWSKRCSQHPSLMIPRLWREEKLWLKMMISDWICEIYLTKTHYFNKKDFLINLSLIRGIQHSPLGPWRQLGVSYSNSIPLRCYLSWKLMTHIYLGSTFEACEGSRSSSFAWH